MPITARITQQSTGLNAATLRHGIMGSMWAPHESWLHLENRLQPVLDNLPSRHQLSGINFLGDQMIEKLKRVCVGAERMYFRSFLGRNRCPGTFFFAFDIPHAQFQLLSQGDGFRTYLSVFYDVCGGVPVDIHIHHSGQPGITVHYPVA